MIAENSFWFLLLLMPMAAFLYASVGHGGASSYLALLTVFNFSPEHIRPTALLLNILVSGFAFLSYRKVCVFPGKLFASLICFSIPAAYLGGCITVDTGIYKSILGIVLLFPALRLLNVFPVNHNVLIEKRWWIAAILGTIIGFFSGLIGIGGGIILSPLLLFMGWANVKETAAMSALFIFLNSISGLIGSQSFGFPIQSELQILMLLTVGGGIVGGYLGANYFNVPVLKYLLATVLLVAATKFLIL